MRCLAGLPSVCIDSSSAHAESLVVRITIVLVAVAFLAACGRGGSSRPPPPAPRTADLPAEPAAVVIAGRITNQEKVALAPSVVVQIQVVDLSRADAPATVVASTEVHPAGGQIPLSYRIAVQRSEFRPDRRYQVNVRITEGKVLRFITRIAHPLDIDRLPERFDILVNAVPQRLW
jgi:putative lipoprotein